MVMMGYWRGGGGGAGQDRKGDVAQAFLPHRPGLFILTRNELGQSGGSRVDGAEAEDVE